jgi:hypothetical protein
MADIAYSTNGVPIRLTSERWLHIVEHHDDVAGHCDDCLLTIEDPDFVLRGYGASLIAMRGSGRRRYQAVVYREVSADDGFVITAYFTSRVNRSWIVWRRNR